MEESKREKLRVVIIILLILILLALVAFATKKVMNNAKEERNKIASYDNTIILENKIEQEIEYEHTDNSLTLDFLKIENPSENFIYSPLSIKYALKMLSEGANGSTKTQIDNLVGNLNLTKYNNIEKVLSFANAIYIQDEYSEYIKEEFKSRLVEKYNAEINYDSFTSASNINNWIERKTLGIIKNMLKDDQIRSSRMLLINALAIDMAWENTFDFKDTYSTDFKLQNGTTMQATTMHQKTSSSGVAYYKDDNVTALTMDLKKYDDTQLEFMAIMPSRKFKRICKKCKIRRYK